MVAQLVERKLPKLEVASSNLVRRFRFDEPYVALRQGFVGCSSRAPCGQARASAGKKVTNLLPPCCHGIGLSREVRERWGRRKSTGGEGLRSATGGPWAQSEPRVRRSGC